VVIHYYYSCLFINGNIYILQYFIYNINNFYLWVSEVCKTSQQIIEEIINHFGRTGSNRARLRKFHAEMFLAKFNSGERVLSSDDINRPEEYIKRIVKYSKGFLTFINEEALEIKLTDNFFLQMEGWKSQYQEIEELDHSDENLLDQGIILTDDSVSFDGRLSYSRFYKVISDEGESMNNPDEWVFNSENIDTLDSINFSNKDSSVFGSRLFNLKFYVLRKIDEVAFVTSRFVHCPACGANYVVPAARIEFQQSYRCEKIIGDKQCKTTLKKFPARKMIPSFIYEIGVEVKGKDGTEFKEFFLESFVELSPGFFTGMCFGRTEQKTNSFYFTCLTAKEEKAKHEFELINRPENKHEFFNLIDSVHNHIQKVGFIIDIDKARLPVIVETLKKLAVTANKEINMDHSLYFGAPGIGKTYALTLLHHMFYSNSGFISGPRFTLPGLTGGQKEIYYQDMSKKKNVPGLFSNQAFVFDEINNAQFLSDDKATNLFKSVALASSGTSTTVGGKEFPRISLISATANYDIDHLKHYENKIRKAYSGEVKSSEMPLDQSTFLMRPEDSKDSIPMDFDFYAPLKKYGIEVSRELKTVILRVRDESKNYLTNFPKPLMERFYWSILVHPKYDKAYTKHKTIDVAGHMRSRKSQYSQRELISQLFIPNLVKIIKEKTKETEAKFENEYVEKAWNEQAREFLSLMSHRYVEFFSMFHRINQVHVFILYSLSLINNETKLSFETRRIFERVISLLHNPIEMEDFHKPDFENFKYLGETKTTVLEMVRRFGKSHLINHLDFDNPNVKKILVELQNDHKIKKINDTHYELDTTKRFEELSSGGNQYENR